MYLVVRINEWLRRSLKLKFLSYAAAFGLAEFLGGYLFYDLYFFYNIEAFS